MCDRLDGKLGVARKKKSLLQNQVCRLFSKSGHRKSSEVSNRERSLKERVPRGPFEDFQKKTATRRVAHEAAWVVQLSKLHVQSMKKRALSKSLSMLLRLWTHESTEWTIRRERDGRLPSAARFAGLLPSSTHTHTLIQFGEQNESRLSFWKSPKQQKCFSDDEVLRRRWRRVDRVSSKCFRFVVFDGVCQRIPTKADSSSRRSLAFKDTARSPGPYNLVAELSLLNRKFSFESFHLKVFCRTFSFGSFQ